MAVVADRYELQIQEYAWIFHSPSKSATVSSYFRGNPRNNERLGSCVSSQWWTGGSVLNCRERSRPVDQQCSTSVPPTSFILFISAEGGADASFLEHITVPKQTSGVGTILENWRLFNLHLVFMVSWELLARLVLFGLLELQGLLGAHWSIVGD